MGSLEEEVLAQLDGKHWTDRPAPWNFEVDAVAQEGILEQLARFSRERKLKTLGLPDEPKAKASQPQDVQVEDASLFWCDPNSFQSDVNQEWQSADPWKSKLVQTSNLPWGLASTNKLWFPPALKHVRPSVRHRLTLWKSQHMLIDFFLSRPSKLRLSFPRHTGIKEDGHSRTGREQAGSRRTRRQQQRR